jgi:hypothetical protein
MGKILNFKKESNCLNCQCYYPADREDSDIFYRGHCPYCANKFKTQLRELKLTTRKGDRINSLEYKNLRRKKRKSAAKRKLKLALS